MSTELKDLLREFNHAQQESKKIPQLRKRIIALIKHEGLTDTKFNFSDKTISYHTYQRYEDISQKLIREVLTEYYPQIDNKTVAQLISQRRKKKVTETIRITDRK